MADDEMQAAPSTAISTGRPAVVLAGAAMPLAVMTVSPYGTDMSITVRGVRDSSQSHFDADQLEAMTGCVELINTGRGSEGEELAQPR